MWWLFCKRDMGLKTTKVDERTFIETRRFKKQVLFMKVNSKHFRAQNKCAVRIGDGNAWKIIK